MRDERKKVIRGDPWEGMSGGRGEVEFKVNEVLRKKLIVR